MEKLEIMIDMRNMLNVADRPKKFQWRLIKLNQEKCMVKDASSKLMDETISRLLEKEE